jgi:hypothetical protein
MAKKHPSDELIKDLAKVFKKHNWSGQPIGLSAGPPNLKAIIGNEDGADCPNGTEAQWVTYKFSDGTWVTKKLCK